MSLIILQEIMKKPSLDSYHSTNPLISTPFFGKCISRNRFLLLIKYLHFAEKGASNEPTIKLQEVWSPFLTNSKLIMSPKNISIDKSLLLWKGRLK